MEVHSTMEPRAEGIWEEDGGPPATTDLAVSTQERQYLQHQHHASNLFLQHPHHTNNNIFTRKRQRHRAKSACVSYNRHATSAHNDDDDEDDDDNDNADDDDDADDCSILIGNEHRSLKARGQVDQQDVTTGMADVYFERREGRRLYGSHHCHHSAPTGEAVVTTWSARATSLSCEGKVGDRAADYVRANDMLDSSAKGVQRIHCVVERVNGTDELMSVDGCDVTEVVKEEYLVLPGDVLMREVVQLVICRLGYSVDTAVRAQGALQLKNWKPLPFHVITDNPTATIDDVLGHVKDFTLRLRLPGKEELGLQEEWRDSSVRCAVVALLRHFNQSTLAKLSPLSQSTISSIASGRYLNHLSRRKCWQFGTWYSSFLKNVANDFWAQTSRRPLPSTRRTTFDPQHELPLLQKWYVTFPAPSEGKFNMFTRILNSGHIRQSKPKLSPQKVKMWWRNERQKEKHLNRTAVTSAKKATKSVSPAAAAAPSLLLPPAVCRSEESRLQGKSARGLMRVSSTCSDTRLVSYRKDTSVKEQRDSAVQHTSQGLRGRGGGGGAGDGEVPDHFCVSLSTDRQMPALVPVISSPDAEALPHNLSSSPSPPLRSTPPPQSAGFAKPLHEQPEKIKEALLPSRGQGQALLPRPPASTWSSTSSLTSWSGHGRSPQDVAAAMSTQPPFFLPAWSQSYLPFLASSADRSRSVTEQKSHFF